MLDNIKKQLGEATELLANEKIDEAIAIFKALNFEEIEKQTAELIEENRILKEENEEQNQQNDGFGLWEIF